MLGLKQILGECGMLAYLSYMAGRLAQIWRILNESGTVYLHCDHTAGHYLKVLMDCIFGSKNFIGDIIWNKQNGVKSRTAWGNENDNILCYAKKKGNHYFAHDDPICRIPFSEISLSMHFKHTDDKGRKFRKRTINGRDYYYYADKGRFIGNLWNDVSSMQANTPLKSESLSYPTQKPVALLDRIVKASSRPGDLVLDPFCGCGTTIQAAHYNRRRWSGIDISPFAVQRVMRKRFRDLGFDCGIVGVPTNLSLAVAMAEQNPFKFESWIIFQVPGLHPNKKQVGDEGVDGRGMILNESKEGRRKVVVQVKSGKPSMSQIRDFMYVCDREKAAAGLFIPMKNNHISTKMKADFRSKGQFKLKHGANTYPRLQFWSVEDFYEGKVPRLPDMTDPVTGKAMPEGLFVSS